MEDKDLYVLAVMRYKEENPNIDANLLFPQNWDSSDDYHLKVEIIANAIQNNVLISETELYRTSFNDGKCITLSNIPDNTDSK
jgi:hypothetical protein